ncbi:MAG: hypothetical protein EP349_08820 [Alphaproteobacteria bacterium]|nr:MAG: hypothetical protein EP349_08820 [Alphaproteobacteria bacterium]
MSFDYWDRKVIEQAVHGMATEPLKKEIAALKYAFESQAPKLPQALKQAPKDGSFYKFDAQTAVKVKTAGSDLTQLYQFDFDTGLATIMTFQQNRLAATETKKLSEMPAKMLGEAQQTVFGSSVRKQPSRIQRRER